MKSDICSMMEVKEVVKKSFLVLLDRKVNKNGVLLQSISEDEDKVVMLANRLDLIRRHGRLFIKKDKIVGYMDNVEVEDRELVSKRLVGNTLNSMNTTPVVEYLDNKAKQHRRS